MRQIDRFVAQHQTLLNRGLLWLAVLAPVLSIVAISLRLELRPSVSGPLLMAVYIAPLLLIGPLWVRHRLSVITTLPTIVIALDAAVFLLSSLRAAIGPAIPCSGHALFLTYSALTTTVSGYRWLALALLLGTTIVKLWLWNDYYSWGLGLLFGFAAAVPALWALRGSARDLPPIER